MCNLKSLLMTTATVLLKKHWTKLATLIFQNIIMVWVWVFFIAKNLIENIEGSIFCKNQKEGGGSVEIIILRDNSNL